VLSASAYAKYEQNQLEISRENSAQNDRENSPIGRTKSMIVGICDARVLQQFETFGALLIIPSNNTIHTNGSLDDACFRGLQTRNSAIFHSFNKATIIAEIQKPKQSKSTIHFRRKTAKTDSSKTNENNKVTDTPHPVTTHSKYNNAFSFYDYVMRYKLANNTQTALICRTAPTAFTIKKMITQIKEMHPKDRQILGTKLLRDNLTELTIAFLQPNITSTSPNNNTNYTQNTTTTTQEIEASIARETLIERAELAEARQKQQLLAEQTDPQV
jgi:hypothetical protein